ncbi:3040_t:CDS:1, partial [Cetraspora pellucida]
TKLANEIDPSTILVSCSALKIDYRSLFKVDKQVLKERLQITKNYFMKADMLESQFKDLEGPNNKNTFTIEVVNNIDMVKKIIIEN